MQIGGGEVLYASQTINRLNQVTNTRNAQAVEVLRMAHDKAQQAKAGTINAAIDAKAQNTKIIGNIIDLMA